MRTVGKKQIPLPQFLPGTQGFELAQVHQATGAALMSVKTSGVIKGVYRYSTHQAANQASENAMVYAIVLNRSQLKL
jgi:hypothetical protein